MTTLAANTYEAIMLEDGQLYYFILEEWDEWICTGVCNASRELKREALHSLRALPEWESLPLSLEWELQ